MLCPKCGGELYVNRTMDLDLTVARNRRCPKCGAYTDTIEVRIDEYNSLVNGIRDDESGRA